MVLHCASRKIIIFVVVMAVNHVQIMLSFQITTAILFVIVATEGLGEKRSKHGLLHFSNSLSLDEYICDN